jgi:AcrR family transcriptional regulator
MTPDRTEQGRISRREREKRRLREEVIRAAAELFSARSYDDTSVHQIAEKAEVSVGTIYNLFEGKDSIFEGLLKMIGENIDSGVQEAIDSASNPVERISSVVGTYLDFCERYRDFMIIIHNENPMKIKGIMKEFYMVQIERIEALYSQAIENGDLRYEDPHLLALVTFGYVNGLLHELFTCNDFDTYHKEDFMSLFDRTMLRPLRRGGLKERETEDS